MSTALPTLCPFPVAIQQRRPEHGAQADLRPTPNAALGHENDQRCHPTGRFRSDFLGVDSVEKVVRRVAEDDSECDRRRPGAGVRYAGVARDAVGERRAPQFHREYCK